MKRLLAALVFFPMLAWAQNAPIAPPPSSAPQSAIDTSQKFGSSCAYPESALRARAAGRTDLSFRVADDGTISDAKVTYSSGNSDLDAAAAQCVARWHVDASDGLQAGQRLGWMTWIIPSSTDSSAAPPTGVFKVNRGAACSTGWYPPAALKAHAEGTAIVEIHIDETGAVSGADIVQSAGNADLDQATVGCVTKSWRFRPALQNGKPVAVSKRYAIRWQIDPNALPPP